MVLGIHTLHDTFSGSHNIPYTKTKLISTVHAGTGKHVKVLLASMVYKTPTCMHNTLNKVILERHAGSPPSQRLTSCREAYQSTTNEYAFCCFHSTVLQLERWHKSQHATQESAAIRQLLMTVAIADNLTQTSA